MVSSVPLLIFKLLPVTDKLPFTFNLCPLKSTPEVVFKFVSWLRVTSLYRKKSYKGEVNVTFAFCMSRKLNLLAQPPSKHSK